MDHQRWIGFDVIQDFNDTYFMSLMFLISGLFVLPSLQRKGVWRHARDRIWRLGVPFAACVTLVMPLAYYPSIRQTVADVTFGQFWAGYFTRYGWPAGPAWFIWFLLALDLSCSLCVGCWPGLLRKAAILPDLVLLHPARSLLAFLVAGLIAYLPAEAVVGSRRWFSLGPFAVQESRIGLYALFFATGAAAGAAGVYHRLFLPDGPIARGWIRCGLMVGAVFAGLLALQIAALHGTAPLSGQSWQMASPVLFVTSCVLSSMALAGLFLRHVTLSGRLTDNLVSNAYGIYLIHYAVLTWTQAALLRSSYGAVPKALTVFLTVLAASWTLTALLRRSRFVRAVL